MLFFHKKVLVGISLFLLPLTSYGQVKSKAFCVMLNGFLDHSVPEIGIQEAARDSSLLVFLDAREPREYAVSHIAGAVSVGYDHFGLENLPIGLPKDRRIVVYCSVGYRSEKVTEKLQKAGFTNVANLYGGIFEWVNQGFPVVSESGPTQNVHAYNRSWGIWLKKGKRVYK